MKTKHHTLAYLSLALGVALVSMSCTRDNDPDPVIPPSEGTEMTLNGGEGGSSAENSVYVDLSAEQQSAVKRDSWNLGFYSGSQFRVILNSTNGSSAIAVDKTDINAVSASDINIDDLAIPLGQPGAFDNIDDVTGDLSKTVIAEIAASEAENKVYVINPKGGSHSDALLEENLYKVRILRSGNDYTLQYAKLSASTFETLTIQKDTDYNFKYVSFATGPATVEPSKADWDIQWTWSLYFGGAGETAYPYGFSDLVFVNHLAGVTTAEVIVEEDGSSTGKPTYADFSTSDINSITFSNSRNIIGSTWRGTSPPNAVGAFTDRYYVIKDAAGNVYKLRFNAMGAGDDGGQRGYPELEYQLVKQG
ncbi:HmuY family protein [Parapedobacter sp. 2B3]|uniref:HmuY family protein n=1 Tax=Parapedobacter sp. 2B3 TaxID=3342381 RepID=UPI0035B5A894